MNWNYCWTNEIKISGLVKNTRTDFYRPLKIIIYYVHIIMTYPKATTGIQFYFIPMLHGIM